MAEEDPWGFDEGDIKEETPAAVDAGVPAAAAAAAAAPAAGGDARPEMDVPSQDDGHYRKPVTLYKHWVRWGIRINKLR